MNRNLGKDNIIEIKYGDEQSIMQHWIKGAPLKLTTHGWDTSVDSTSNKQSLVVEINFGMINQQLILF